MNRRYLEIYSANRNREQFPNMAQFDILFGASRNVDNPTMSYDPVLRGPIYNTWQGGQGVSGVTGISVGVLKAGSTDALPLLRQTNGNPIQGLLFGPTGPTMLSSVNNYLQGYGFEDLTNPGPTGQGRLITNYTPQAASITLNTALSASSPGHSYIIYDPSNPSLMHIPTVDGLGNVILSYQEAYNGYYIVDENLSNGSTIVSRKIIAYDYITQIATLESPFPTTWEARHFFTLRKTLPSEKMRIIGITGGQVELPSDVASPITNYYRGNYMYNTTMGSYTGATGTYINTFTPNGNNQAFYISYYGGESGISATNLHGTIYPYCASLISSAGSTIIPGTYVGPTGNNVINIVNFDHDNCSPLIYNGGLVTQNESVCYEIALINLSLPNVVLKTGSRIAFYPFVYVQLTNISAPATSSGIQFYTNNPDAYNALFQAPVTDISNPVNSSFLKIDGGAMTQTIKFKPNDSLRFSVFLPNGELFEPVMPDNPSPFEPNVLLQIDAMFSIRRL